MKASVEGLVEVASHEGIVTSPYLDSVGVWTFGIGHTKNAGGLDPLSLPKGVQQNLPMIMDVFEKDIEKFTKRVLKKFGSKRLKQHQLDGALSFDFNTGGIHRASWADHFINGNVAAARKGFMNWRRPSEIIPRRRKERDLFFEGKYGNGIVSVYPASAKGRVLWGMGKRINLANVMAGGADRPVKLAPNDPMADGLLIKGERGDPIVALSAELIDLGFLKSQPKDKIFTSDVEDAVKSAQELYGLKPDGIAGPKTFDAITKALGLDDDPASPVQKTPEKKPTSSKSKSALALILAALAAAVAALWDKM